MIRLSIDSEQHVKMKLKGTDEKIIDEVSTALIVMLRALESSEGNSVQNNLGRLIVHLIFKSAKERKGLTYGSQTVSEM